MIWPHHIPTFPPTPETPAHPPLEPVAGCSPLRPLGYESAEKRQASYAQDRVGAWMQQPVVTCAPDDNLGELMELLSVHSISGVPVVDADGNLLGVVSQTDVAAYLGGLYGEQSRGGHPQVDSLLRQRKVEEIFSPTAHCVSPEANLHQVVEMMLREHVHRLPVLLEGKLVGLISTLDVLRILRDRHIV